MVNKFASLTVVFALICTLSGTNASASTPSDPDANAKSAEVALESGNPAKNEVQPHDKLRADMQKLIAEARAGKVAPAAPPSKFNPPRVTTCPRVQRLLSAWELR